MVGAIATIGDLVSPRERGQYMGYMMAAMMVAMIAGPLVGGYITDTLSWRWIFYINMPIGGAALLYIIWTLRLKVAKIAHKIDYLGAAVLAVAATAIVLVTTWGGTQYGWGSGIIVFLVLLGIASTAGFIWVEFRAAEPILPMHVFKNRNFSLASGMSFLLGLAMFGAMTFLPLYQQTVQHASPTVSGLLLIPMMLGATTTSLLAGQITVRTGKYKALPIVGSAIMTVGMLLLGYARPDDVPAGLDGLLPDLRRGHGLPDADHHADRAEQRGAEGHGRGQQFPLLLPADRRLDRRLDLRRGLLQGAELLARRQAARRALRRLDQPGRLAPLRPDDPGSDLRRHRARPRHGLHLGRADRRDRVRAGLAGEGDPAPRPDPDAGDRA